MYLMNKEKRDWQTNLSIKDQKLQMNQQNVKKRLLNVNTRMKKL